jgi:MFS transporter, ACS family, pantothenate transporter
LKEDFGLYGNELNYFNVSYYTAYVVFQIPFLLLISRPKLYVRIRPPAQDSS